MRYGFRESTKTWILKTVVALLLLGASAGATRSAFAQDSKPDPAGTATGDKSSTMDAAGNSFVVTEPTDKSIPPSRITIVMPVATRPVIDTCRKTSVRLL